MNMLYHACLVNKDAYTEIALFLGKVKSTVNRNHAHNDNKLKFFLLFTQISCSSVFLFLFRSFTYV